MHYDTLIIGAGMSGLAAGIRLAQFDKRVAILEKHYLWGGLNSFYKRGGRRFDSGLHALTNYVPSGTRGAPLTKILRQLRIRHAELKLGEQRYSEIVHAEHRLRFSNDPALLTEEVAREFPGQVDAFRRLCDEVRAFDLAVTEGGDHSARAALRDRLGDAELVDALLVPLCYYGSARVDDIGWEQFLILFRSILLEGLSRPDGGVKHLLDVLVKRYRELGGELRMQDGVARIETGGGCVRGVVLESGEELTADVVLSSAGRVETMRLCGAPEPAAQEVGRLTFMETISVLDAMPADLGSGAAVAFYNFGERFRYGPPQDSLCDDASGVVSMPNNFETNEPMPEGMLRVTILANYDRWAALDEDEYTKAKAHWSDRALAAAAPVAFDARPHEVFRDTFSPMTIRRFTGHENGAVYGSPQKSAFGETGVEGLYLCGTDQGYLGIVGAMLSGISMANRHALMAGANH